MSSLYRYALDNEGSIFEPDVPVELTNSNNAINPSCVYYKGKLLISFRCVNYTKNYKIDEYDILYGIKNQDYLETEKGINSYTIIGEFIDGKVLNYRLMNEPIGFEVNYSGLEDVRLIVWNDKLYAYGTRWDKVDNKGCICIYELNDNYQAIKEIIVKSPKDSFCEKNWAAIEGKPFQFVYYHNPLEIVQVDPDTGDSKIIETKKYNEYVPDNLRGGTQVIELGNGGYMSIAHTTDIYVDNQGITKFNYHFYAVYYYDNLDILDVSEPFNFNQDLNEFCCGLCSVGKDLYIAYSELDATASIMKINKYDFNDFKYINDVGKLDEKYAKETPSIWFYDRAVNYLNKGLNRKAISFYNFSLIGLEKSEAQLKALIAYLSNYVYDVYLMGDLYRQKYYDVVMSLMNIYDSYIEFRYLAILACKMIGVDYHELYISLDKNKALANEFEKFINKDYIN